MQPNYYAILTAEVRYDKSLSPLEKLLFAEVTALSNNYWYCRASNKYFADLYDRNEKYISSVLSKLQKSWYIEIIIDQKKWNDRKIYIGIQKNLNTPIQKNLNTYSEKPEHNNIKNNTRINTIINNDSEEENISDLWDKKDIIEKTPPPPPFFEEVEHFIDAQSKKIPWIAYQVKVKWQKYYEENHSDYKKLIKKAEVFWLDREWLKKILLYIIDDPFRSKNIWSINKLLKTKDWEPYRVRMLTNIDYENRQHIKKSVPDMWQSFI